MSVLKWQVNSSLNFGSIFIVVLHNSSVNFKLIHSLLLIKGSHRNRNIETFECSSKNLPNSSCHFPKHKSVFLQILHDSSLSWNITPLYFFSSKIIYFVQKEHIKVHIFETFECSGQNFSNFSSQFWNDKSIPLQIFQCHETQLLYNFLAEVLYTLMEHIKVEIWWNLREQLKVLSFALWLVPFV